MNNFLNLNILTRVSPFGRHSRSDVSRRSRAKPETHHFTSLALRPGGATSDRSRDFRSECKQTREESFNNNSIERYSRSDESLLFKDS